MPTTCLKGWAMIKKIKVNLQRQLLFAYDGNKQVFKFDCATGDKEHPTDIGRFTIFKKDRKHFSQTYRVQMDYAMFFTQDGKAIHMSHAVGPVSYLKYLGADYFGSHGCVRLAEKDAKILFDWTPLHTAIEIVVI
jgi:lipoprotein-anchoring transpeptidase ErfK/SrfK